MVNNNYSIGDTLRIRRNSSKNDRQQKPRKQYLNFGEDDQMEIQGFTFNKMKHRIVWIFYILTCGLLRLMFHWYPQWKIWATHTSCSLQQAEKVFITDNYKGRCKSYFVKDVKLLSAIIDQCEDTTTNQALIKFHLIDGTTKELPEVRIIRCKKLNYIWDAEKMKFVKLAGLENGILRSDLHKFSGQNQNEQFLKRIIYGSNEISVPVQTILTLLVLEALTPFYIFQLFSLIVWFAEYYYYYTIAIIIMSVFGISTSIIQTRKNQMNLKGTVHSSDRATVCRGNNQYEEIPTVNLVPGDLILISSQGCEMQCDAVLLNGSCVVNESMLTGESVPVTKTPIPDNTTPYHVKSDINHTLFCGTKIIQTRSCGDEKILAVVIRTGYLTTKGELVRSIMYPPPADFKFDQDSYKFIGILCILATLGFIYTIVSKSSRNIAAIDILIKALDLVTIAVPPALPAAMTVGKLYALSRLKNNKIFCINSRVINVSGSIDCVCFDKTGTLTEDELDMLVVVPVEESRILPAVKEVETMPCDARLIRGMASCHSLNLINGELCGDPLDVKMFESTGWSLEEIPPENRNEANSTPTLIKPTKNEMNLNIHTVQLFQFSSTLQRMSVITKASDKPHYEIFCKGSPEMIMSLSEPSTVPLDITTELKNFTEQGYRVIAMGYRSLPLDQIKGLTREQVENNLTFLGLIVLENKLKPQTTEVITTLRNAGMKIVMITGDNIQTAVNVAKECRIIDGASSTFEVVVSRPTKYDFATIHYYLINSPKLLAGDLENYVGFSTADIEAVLSTSYNLVITGSSWFKLTQYFPELVPKIVAKGVVFARMSGLQKQQLIEEFKNLEYYVAMCGDGANDCGALRAAHVGISLSEAESSVASPFTSKVPDITCVPKVIKEGRAALVTSFGVFKLMLCYSLTEFVSVIILYAIDTNLTSLQYLFIDVFLILNFASFFGKTKAYEVLDKTPPMTSLLGFVPLSSIVLFMFLTIVFQAVSYHLIKNFDWFTPFVFNPNNTTVYDSYENYAIFTVSMFQYITMAVVFSKGKPYRKQIYTNKLFSFAVLLMILVCSYITLAPHHWLQKLFELKMPPFLNARVAILGLSLLNFVLCMVVEDFLVEYVLKTIIRPRIRKTDRKYLRVLSELCISEIWSKAARARNDDPVIFEKVSENGVVNIGFELSEKAT